MELSEKLTHLCECLRMLGGVAVAFSGGVDSTFLAVAAQKVLKERTIAITADSALLSHQESSDVNRLVGQLGLRHVWLETDDLANSFFVANSSERCYYCKKERFAKLVSWAGDNGFSWVAEGSNADDLADYRPGMKAVKELATVRSPLLEAGFTKTEIRVISREWGLPTWDKPSAACLASRLAYGLPVTTERLSQIDLAEQLVRRYVTGQIRVRHHGNLARIEAEPSQAPVLCRPDVAKAVSDGLKLLGFTFVALDLGGYRSGSMNEVLDGVK